MKQLLLFTIFLMLFSSCEQDDKTVAGSETDVLFSFVVSDMVDVSDRGASKASLTKIGGQTNLGANEQATKKVDNLWVLQFDGTAETSLLVRASYLANMGSVDGSSAIPLVLTGSKNPDHRVYFVANTYDRLLYKDNSVVGKTTMKDIIDASKEVSTINATIAGLMPMLGTYTGIIEKGVMTGATNTVAMVRLFAKVTFIYKIGVGDHSIRVADYTNKADSLTADQSQTLAITGIRVVNVPQQVDLFTDLENPKAAYEDNSSGIALREINLIDGRQINHNEDSITFYMPENIAGVITAAEDPNTSGSGTNNLFNDFQTPSDKFHDFNANGVKDDTNNDYASSSTKKPTYVELTAKRVIKAYAWSAEDPSVEFRADSTQTVTIRMYLGDITVLLESPKDTLYNNFNVNANRLYRISTTIDAVGPTDQRITLGALTKVFNQYK